MQTSSKSKQLCVVIALLCSLSACISAPTISESPGPIPSFMPETPPEPPRSEREILSELLNKRILKSRAETQSLDVYYVTNREVKGQREVCSDRFFGVGQGKLTHFGLCRLNVPKKSRVGVIQPTEDPRADSHLFYRVQSHKKLDRESLENHIIAQKPESLLVFVHGFNVKFEESVFRVGQIAQDLKYQGLPIVFSWPAGAEEGLTASWINKTYEKNYQAAIKSRSEIKEFFLWLARLKIPLHVVVHSMGHQVVVPVLAALGVEGAEPIVDELILNAPDLSIDDFHRFAPELTKVAKRVTVYCSFNDNAIAASETYNNGRRLGACATAEGIDVINVSEVDAPTLGLGLGHGYYSSRPIITDVFQLLLGLEAEKRLFLRKSEPNSVENYYLRP